MQVEEVAQTLNRRRRSPFACEAEQHIPRNPSSGSRDDSRYLTDAPGVARPVDGVEHSALNCRHLHRVSEDHRLIEGEEPLRRNMDKHVALVPDRLGPALLLAGQIHLREDLLGQTVVRARGTEGVEVGGDEHSSSGERVGVCDSLPASVGGDELEQPWPQPLEPTLPHKPMGELAGVALRRAKRGAQLSQRDGSLVPPLEVEDHLGLVLGEGPFHAHATRLQSQPVRASFGNI